MRSWTAIATTLLLAVPSAQRAPQAPVIRPVEENVLREYTGVYQGAPNGPDAFVYLQMWDEFTGFGKPMQLVDFEESGAVRALFPTGPDRFFAGPGVNIKTSIEATIEFRRDRSGKVIGLTWRREGSPPRLAQRVQI